MNDDMRCRDLTRVELSYYVSNIANLVYTYLNGRINTIIYSDCMEYNATGLKVAFVDTPINSSIIGGSLIKKIVFGFDEIINRSIYMNSTLYNLKSVVITCIAHELAHLDQITYADYYDEKDFDRGSLIFEMQNVTFTTKYLTEHYKELRKVFGRFDPVCDKKHSMYLRDKNLFAEYGTKPRQLLSGLHESIITTIGSAFAIDLYKAEKDFEVISIVYDDRIHDQTRYYANFKIKWLIYPTKKSQRKIEKMARLIDSIWRVERQFCFLHISEVNPKELVIWVGFDKGCDVVYDFPCLSLKIGFNDEVMPYLTDRFQK